MDVLVNICKVTLEEGLMYAILALGVYLSYSILDFPDLSVDGTMPLGAVVTGLLILHGVDPRLCLIAAFASGVLGGILTGILHVKLHIRPLLCGILTYTALLSVNLVLLLQFNGGSSVAAFFRNDTIFDVFPATLIPESLGGFRLRQLFVALLLAVVCKLLLDSYLKTKSGLLLQATGDNARFVSKLGQDPGSSKILGLALANGFAALAGSVIAQAKSSADQQMGVGMVVLGLSSVIIGLSLFRRCSFMKATTMVVLGSISYKACLTVALTLGLPTEYLKLLMAALFVLALLAGEGRKKRIGGLKHAA